MFLDSVMFLLGLAMFHDLVMTPGSVSGLGSVMGDSWVGHVS